MLRRKSKLDGIEPYIIECMCLNYSEQEALLFLSTKGYDISPASLYKLKASIKEDTQGRLNLIAQEGFIASHLETLDILRMIQSQLIELAKNEKNNTKKANILMQLAQIREKIAIFMDASKWVLEQGIKLKKKRKQEQLEEA
jgi:hypothetical protein